jgi:hypothetical protein
VLRRSGIGGISELHDLSGARGPEFQTWSMAGFLEAVHAFAGVGIDVPGRRITVRPQVPSDWPHLRVRKWYGRTPLDVQVERSGSDLHMRVETPWGEAPDAEIDLGLMLPARSAPRHVSVTIDGTVHVVPWVVEPVPGTPRSRLRLQLAACSDLEIRVHLVKRARRLSVPA